MLNEFQPTKKARCECGAVLWDGDDTRYPFWIGGDPDCLHRVIPPDLAEIDDKMDEIIERINKSTQIINELNSKL